MIQPLILYKNEGETPLACIDRAREDGKIDRDIKATYAGRLDPMAEGILLVLAGKDVHEKETLLKLPKEYEVQVLLGISSDTGDVLGMLQKVDIPEAYTRETIQDALKKCIGTSLEEYPKYSSKTLEGKSLFSLARLGRIFSSPTHMVTIHSIVLQNTEMIRCQDLVKEIVARIEKVKGDFRQVDIKDKWQDVARDYGETNMQIVSVKVSCESGAYMRVLAEKIGALLDCPALALRIKRTRVGDYHI